ncbi:copper homeostasis protein CutC [Paenibacillus antri]|uniref:PF03932 family protein CutC n=1 Tax=Paenibacillus antri TaxID=2582848 RepID=A0A5R9GIY1_9BACL|nr:copper homeostasis protein CutC [Paenibacillus antri]TLS54300.1 copper homeostasis protein CutC [Paenibacillus antri]
MIIEVIAIRAGDVEAACKFGANRIELVTGIAEGGLTPSAGLIERAVRTASIPVNVMLRPHSQSFVYGEEDYQVLLRDLNVIREAGAAGFVFGALTEEGDIDRAGLERILEEAGGLDMTFHRAFDEIEDQEAALRTLALYPQIKRVLTSGGKRPAPEAIPQIRRLSSLADELGLRILAGHGLKPDTVGSFAASAGVREVHFGSGVRENGSFDRPIDPERMRAARRNLGS